MLISSSKVKRKRRRSEASSVHSKYQSSRFNRLSPNPLLIHKIKKNIFFFLYIFNIYKKKKKKLPVLDFVCTDAKKKPPLKKKRNFLPVSSESVFTRILDKKGRQKKKTKVYFVAKEMARFCQMSSCTTLHQRERDHVVRDCQQSFSFLTLKTLGRKKKKSSV